jgi:hypothetical protein
MHCRSVDPKDLHCRFVDLKELHCRSVDLKRLPELSENDPVFWALSCLHIWFLTCRALKSIHALFAWSHCRYSYASNDHEGLDRVSSNTRCTQRSLFFFFLFLMCITIRADMANANDQLRIQIESISFIPYQTKKAEFNVLNFTIWSTEKKMSTSLSFWFL